MLDVLIYLFENYYAPESCPDSDTLARKLAAVGFENEEISDALDWLDGLNQLNDGSYDGADAGSGAIDLPTVDVVWWNTFEDHLEHTSLPARTLSVANNPGLMVDTPAGVTPVISAADNEALWWWKLSTLMLACTTLLGFGLWWRARWQPAILRAAQAGPSPRTVLDDLKRACQANDTHATRQALDAWARQQPETLADMAARFVPLSDALDGLNGALYSESGQHWQGEELWRAIRAIPMAERAQDPLGDSGLPPLYPK